MEKQSDYLQNTSPTKINSKIHVFVSKLKERMRNIRTTPTTQHNTRRKPLTQKTIDTYTHIFLWVDKIRGPLKSTPRKTETSIFRDVRQLQMEQDGTQIINLPCIEKKNYARKTSKIRISAQNSHIRGEVCGATTSQSSNIIRSLKRQISERRTNLEKKETDSKYNY